MERALESQNERSVKLYLCRTPHLLDDFVRKELIVYVDT